MDNRATRLIDLFHSHGESLTLGQILERYDLIGSKYTNAISEARRILETEGKTITCLENKELPTRNVYTVIDLERHFDTEGQGHLIVGV